jgi:hypothetical protein
MERPKGALSSKEIERFARRTGLVIETGRGKHGKHIVGPDGKRHPLPDHGRGIISVGVRYSLIKFIDEYSSSKKRVA